MMAKRRGKRVVVGFVVSHTGKRGGPWVGVGGMWVTRHLSEAERWPTKVKADEIAEHWTTKSDPVHPNARALPLVRYELDAEEERLRDAVVEAAARWESPATPLYHVPSAAKGLESAVRALRAHREKVGNPLVYKIRVRNESGDDLGCHTFQTKPTDAELKAFLLELSPGDFVPETTGPGEFGSFLHVRGAFSREKVGK